MMLKMVIFQSYSRYISLFGGLEHVFYFPFDIWEKNLPIDELIFFKMVKTINQYIYIMIYIRTYIPQ